MSGDLLATVVARVTPGHMQAVANGASVSGGGSSVSVTTGLREAHRIVDELIDQGEDAWIDRTFPA